MIAYLKCCYKALDLKNPPGEVYRGPPKGKADCTLTMSDDDLVKMATGELDAQKVEGSAIKVTYWLPSYRHISKEN